MKWFNRIFTTVAGILTFRTVRNFFDKYEILIFDKEDLAEDDEEFTALDLRGTPTHECVCGSRTWYIKAIFESYEIASYFLDMQCSECGSMATAPTLLDREGTE